MRLTDTIRAVADRAPRRANQALVHALEEAQADSARSARLADQWRHRSLEAETQLRAVIRGIDTAPLSTYVRLPANGVNREVAVKSGHVDWPQLNRALGEAKRFLAGHRRG